jgi:hypothetical protein
LQFVEIVEISVSFQPLDHEHLMIKWYDGHGQNGHFDHDHLENSKVVMVGPPTNYENIFH